MCNGQTAFPDLFPTVPARLLLANSQRGDPGPPLHFLRMKHGQKWWCHPETIQRHSQNQQSVCRWLGWQLKPVLQKLEALLGQAACEGSIPWKGRNHIPVSGLFSPPQPWNKDLPAKGDHDHEK